MKKYQALTSWCAFRESWSWRERCGWSGCWKYSNWWRTRNTCKSSSTTGWRFHRGWSASPSWAWQRSMHSISSLAGGYISGRWMRVKLELAGTTLRPIQNRTCRLTSSRSTSSWQPWQPSVTETCQVKPWTSSCSVWVWCFLACFSFRWFLGRWLRSWLLLTSLTLS